jgi:hypothetical protein
LRCTAVIAGVLGRAGEEGRELRLQMAKEGKILARSNMPGKPAGNDKRQGGRR